MRLSDAIATGRVLLLPITNSTGGPGDGRTFGCALQIALHGVGRSERAATYRCLVGGMHPDYGLCNELWGSKLTSLVFSEYDNWQYEASGRGAEVNLDAFIDWVRSIEPSEPPPQPSSAATSQLALVEVKE